MLENVCTGVVPEFFAAANSGRGFVSFYGEIFNTDNLFCDRCLCSNVDFPKRTEFEVFVLAALQRFFGNRFTPCCKLHTVWKNQ